MTLEVTLEERIEKAFNEQEPSCLSCGWSNAFFELGEWEETAPGEFHTSCRSKDADDSWQHRGYFVYLRPPKEDRGIDMNKNCDGQRTFSSKARGNLPLCLHLPDRRNFLVVHSHGMITIDGEEVIGDNERIGMALIKFSMAWSASEMSGI